MERELPDIHHSAPGEETISGQLGDVVGGLDVSEKKLDAPDTSSRRIFDPYTPEYFAQFYASGQLDPKGFWVTDLKADLKGINPAEDFSENGQWLYRELGHLAHGLETDMLQVFAQETGHNLQVAIEELKKFEFVDDTRPGILRLTAMKWIPYGKSE
jgi:hypothetical protein